MNVRVATEEDFDAIHAWAETNYDPEFQCSSGPPYPSRRHFSRLARTHTIRVAEDGAEIVGFCVHDEGGVFAWLMCLPERWTEVAGELICAVHEATGNASGHSDKLVTLQRVAQAYPGMAVADGWVKRMRE